MAKKIPLKDTTSTSTAALGKKKKKEEETKSAAGDAPSKKKSKTDTAQKGGKEEKTGKDVGKKKSKTEQSKGGKEEKGKGDKGKGDKGKGDKGKGDKGKEMGKGKDDAKGVKGKKCAQEPEPEPLPPPKSPSQIDREEAENRKMQRKRKIKPWPEVSKVKITTKPWSPPGPPGKPPKVIINLPELQQRRWKPPHLRQRKPRPRLLRIPPDQITQPLYECKRLKKIWHGFVQVDRNKMMLQGRLACNSMRNANGICGYQTGCIALVTRGLLEEKPLSALRRWDVEGVLHEGEGFYNQCLMALKFTKSCPELELNQLLNTFYFHDTKYTVKLQEVDKGVLSKNPEVSDSRPDLMTLMQKRVGTKYMLVMTVAKDHFLIWGHPPDSDSGSHVKTICYIFIPFMLNESGQPDRSARSGGAAFLRYAGVNAFVTDFIDNYGNLHIHTKTYQNPSVTLTEIQVVQEEPFYRDPTYGLDLKTLKVHCQDEWECLHKNELYEKKIHQGQHPLTSISAASVATSKSRAKKKMAEYCQKQSKEPQANPPVLHDKAPPEPTNDQIMELRGEDFFLQCPKTDAHTYGRDDLIPFSKEELMLGSPVDVADKNFNSQFSQLNAETWLLRGTRHFAVVRYEKFKSYTGVACCVTALGMLRRLRARGWNEDTINETLDLGYNLFRDSLKERGGPVRRLVLGELKDIFKIRDREYKFKTRGIAVWGKLYSTDPKVYDLYRGLEQFFKESDAGILQVPGDLETAIWNEGGKYYLYHPWPADKNGRRVSLQGGGKACLMYFSHISGLCDHFLESTEDLKRKAFSIADVLVFDVGKRPEPVNHMKPVGASRWVVLGDFHEGDERFPESHRNKQATPSAIAAIAMSHVIDPTEWKPQDIDEILIRGDILYENTIEHLDKLGINLDMPTITEEAAESEELGLGQCQGPSGTLAAADVLPRFRITGNDHVEVDIMDSAFTGTLNPDADGQGIMTLRESLGKLFERHKAGVLTARGSSIGVWRHDNHLYMFDPHGCDDEGNPSDDSPAAAALIRMSNNVKDLADVILNNLPPGSDDSFNLSTVEVTISRIHPETGAPEHKLANRAFDWMNRGTAAILLGPRGENSAIGKSIKKARVPEDDLDGHTIATPCAAAFLAATESVPPPFMHQDHIYNFLEAGADYYNNYTKTKDPNAGDDPQSMIDMSKKFEMGANTFSVEVGEGTTLPLRLPDKFDEGADEEEGLGAMGGEEDVARTDAVKEMKDLLNNIWYDSTKPTTLSLLCGDYHTLGVWMQNEGKVVVFDPCPTLYRGLLTPQRLKRGDQLRNQRLKGQMTGEAVEEENDEELDGEGEEKPEPEKEYVPPDSCAALMVFATPGEFIDRLVLKGGLTARQAMASYTLYPVTVINELTSLLKEKRLGATKDGEEEEDEEDLIEPLDDAAIGTYFERMSRSIASVRGRLAQNENYFLDSPNRDNQDAATAVMGIVVDHIEPYIHWKPSLIDSIIKYGDRLYTTSLPNARSPPHLTPGEIQKEFHVVNFNVKLEIQDNVVDGDVKAGDGNGPLSIRKGLQKFFDEGKNYAVVCTKGYCVAVWRAADGKAFCYWDPHPTGPRGKSSPNGAAGLILFSTIDELAETYRSNVEGLKRPGPNRFYISSVTVFWEFAQKPAPVTPQGAVPDEGYEWKVLTAFSEIARGRTILRGSRPCDLARFIRDSQLQSACSAIVGTCMAHLRRPHLWTKKTVNEIISIGCQLFTASVGQLGYEFRPGDDILMPLQVVKRFVLGVNYISYDLLSICNCKLDQKDPQVPTLTSAIEKFFEDYTHGILWIPPHAFGLWRVSGAPSYYLLEPSASGPTGLRADAQDDGAACVMTFTSPKLMGHAILENYKPECRARQEFQIYSIAVTVRPIKKFKAEPPLIKKSLRGAVPATSKVGIDGRYRRADESDRKHPPGNATCLDVAKAADEKDKDDTKYKGIRNSSGWLVLSDGTQFLSAQHSMACKKFPYGSRGYQALACCVMAVAMSRVEDVCRWCQTTLDQILECGDQLYQDSYLHYKPKGTKILNITQILRKFYTPGNCVCRVVVFEPRQQGVSDEDLVCQLTQFFREEKTGVFVAGNGVFAVALFRTPRGYYMFDPADRDRYGRAVEAPCTGKARACFSQYPNVDLLAEKLSSNIPPSTPPDNKEDGSKEKIEETQDGSEEKIDENEKSEVNQKTTFTIYGMDVSSLQKMDNEL